MKFALRAHLGLRLLAFALRARLRVASEVQTLVSMRPRGSRAGSAFWAVRCYDGPWCRGGLGRYDVDLARFSQFAPRGCMPQDGSVPVGDLMGAFATLLERLGEEYRGEVSRGGDPLRPRNLVWYCRKGHHRSAGILVLFLIWATGLPHPSLFTEALSSHRGGVWLADRRRGNQVPYGEVARLFANRLAQA